MRCAATLVLIALAPATASAEGPSSQALEALGHTREQLEQAKKDADEPIFIFGEDLRAARNAKLEFVLAAFRDVTLLGGCRGDELIFLLDSLDVKLEQAEHGSGKTRRQRLQGAREDARKLDDLLGRCAQSAAAGAGDPILDKIGNMIKEEKEGKLSGKELRRKAGRVLKLKRDLLQGETVEGCDVVELFVLIEQVDLLIVRAKETKPNDFDNHGKRKAARERREILTRAVELVRQLTRTYQKLPCDPTDDAPPPPPPGTRACSDGVDNDADRLTDGPDPGCRTGAGFFQFFPFAPWDPDDRSEQDVSATISCATPQTRTLVNANSGATLIRHRLLGFAGAQHVAVERESTDGDFASGGPVPLATNGPSCSAPSPQDPTQLSASWSVSGTTVTWTVVSTGGGGGSAGLLAAANTR